ncbi:MAG TPA: hypothetical protein VHT51_19455 [Micropepsaceae bacterium]|jgi:hypothetical protein|nr:hypothetical protein [Micropepsaceae bacterium]
MPVSSGISVLKWRVIAACAAAAFLSPIDIASSSAVAAPGAIPDFSSGGVGWRNDHNDFILPSNGPGPVTWDPAHPYRGNGEALPPTSRVADLTNPILMPWVRDVLQKFNANGLAGEPQFTSIARCWPAGVPGTMLLRINPTYIVQTPKEVWLLYQSDHQVRRIAMDRPHSAKVALSWYGESVGHYEGDTLVVDTIGISTKVAVDFYLTPHTDRLHVVERYRLLDGGNTLEIAVTVEDPGAFSAPWTASQRYQKVSEPLKEVVCAEGESSAPKQDPQQDIVPIPRAERPDF